MFGLDIPLDSVLVTFSFRTLFHASTTLIWAFYLHEAKNGIFRFGFFKRF